jgi:Cysteine-rich secretory protein family
MLPDLPQTEIAIVAMTNAFRKEYALNDLRPNAALTAAARAFAQYLARTGTFAHDSDGRLPQQRAAAQGYKYCFIAENLALNVDSRGFASRGLARQTLEGWKRSPGHRANLLRANLTEIGVAVERVPDANPKFVSVQLFGQPESARFKFRIENKANAPVRYVLGESLHTLPVGATVTHTQCNPAALRFEQADHPRTYRPRADEHFLVRAGLGGLVRVDVERK